MEKCECYVFTPTLMLHVGCLQPLDVAKHPTIISESLVFGVDMEDILEGFPDELTEGKSGMHRRFLLHCL